MSTREIVAELTEGLEMFLSALKKMADQPDPDAWVDQATSPLGRRRHCSLSRRGVLPGARKVAGRWLVRRREIDAFVEGHPGGDDAGEAAREVAAVLAFRAPARAKRAGKR